MQEYQALGHMSLVNNPALHESHCIYPTTAFWSHRARQPSYEWFSIPYAQKHRNYRFMTYCWWAALCKRNSICCFRPFQYALTADVAKMYRQVLVNKSFRKYQYIF